MKSYGSVSKRHVAIGLAVLPLIWLAGACERKTETAQPGDVTSSAESFQLPEADASGLPDGLQARISMQCTAAEQSPENPDYVGALGALYYVHGFPEAAAKCFERAQELAPQSMHWWYYLALAYELAEEPQKAINAYERALELDANYVPVYVRLAEMLVKSNRERALNLSQRALELRPEDPGALFTLGLCAEAAGEHAAALQRFEQALQTATDYGDAHSAMARVLTALNREAEAEQHRAAAETGKTPVFGDELFETLLRNGGHIEILLRDALLLAEGGAFEQVDALLARAAEADRSGLFTHRATGLVRAMQGRYEEAAEQFRLVLEARPETVEVRADLAGALTRLAKHAEAEAEFRAALEHKPDSRYVLERYCAFLMGLERGEQAEKLMRDALERQPDEAWIHFQLGSVLLAMDEDGEAVEQFEACLRTSPNHIRARYSLGLVARRAEDYASAREHWEQVIQEAPGFLEVYIRLAEAAMQQRDFAAAERYLRDGLTRAPNYAGLANSLAWILATSPDDDQRDGEEALQLAKKACESTPNPQHGHLDTLAAAYAELGRFDEAVTTVREAIKLAEGVKDEDAVAGYRKRLELYEQQKPYREEG